MENIFIEYCGPDGAYSYATKDNMYTIAYETPGCWVLRKDGKYVDKDSFRTSLATRNGFIIKFNKMQN